jgi:type 1 glutamine amidotransferase
MRTMWLGLAGALLLAGLAVAGEEAAPKKIQVLILSGANNHNWKATTPFMKELLEKSGRFDVKVTDTPGTLTADDLKAYDVLLDNYNGPAWGKATQDAVLAFVHDEGRGFVVIHAANNAFGAWKEFDAMIGGAWRKGAGHGGRHRFNARIVDKEHPITKGMPDFHHAIEEFYHNMTMQPDAHVIAQAFSSKKHGGTDKIEPISWVVSYGKGRAFQTVLGHDVEAMKGAGFAAFLTRGTEWAATGQVTIPVPADMEPAKDGLPESPEKP